MLILQNISYLHPNKDPLFENLSLTVGPHEKIAIIGNNGSGKSSLLKIIARQLQPSGGQLSVDAEPYFVPQVFGQLNHLSIAEALQIDKKLTALREITEGNISEHHLSQLDDDWSIGERCTEALNHWDLHDLEPDRKLGTLSGGQKTRVLLSGISIHEPDLILLDEPSNHLDTEARQKLYRLVASTKSTLIVVSHDRKLLNQLDLMCQLDKKGITVYGGNYDFYSRQKQSENDALSHDILNKERSLRKAKEKEKETIERQQRTDARGKGKQDKAGVARIMMNTLRNKAEKSTSKIKSVHAEKTGDIARELSELRSTLPDTGRMRFGFDRPAVHAGKVLLTLKDVNFSYIGQPLWKDDLSFRITEGDRIALKGANGSGKTTLIRLIMGSLSSCSGMIERAGFDTVYIDQDYSLIDDKLDVYTQAQKFNNTALQEHEIKIRLHRFLFPAESWDQPCRVLSGGERMRLMLCCLTIGNQAPDMIILDEPTNNLDIRNIDILIGAINEYRGTLLAVSHDELFLEQIRTERIIEL